MDESQSFGEWLRRRRRELDLTQEELARRTGCARVTIRKIEADQIRPSKQLAGLLREQLGIPGDESEGFIHFARNKGGRSNPITATTPKHNLPHSISSFIGREREIAEIENLMKRSRLVTLTGAGGSGKTRLALQVAGQLMNRYSDGVWFVSFAPLSESALIQQAIASVLKAREESSRPLIETLADLLRSRDLLLIFDNCEHLIAECARTAEKLLQACPQLHILATSREVLNIEGERQFYVPPLVLLESLQLFVERAQAVQPAFNLTDQNSASIIQICQHLDGIPLALELAAARVKDFSVEQIAVRLDDRFHLLTGGSRTALPRQHTLQATMDWSYKLLSEEERATLQRLSVFAGGWGLDAAEFICTENGIESNQILELLTHLIDKSLVIAETAGSEPRYHLLETIRQYAREKLEESGEAGQIQTRHLNYLLAWGERAELGFRSRDFQPWVVRMDLARDNLRAALNYAIDSSRPESALQLIGSTFWIWMVRGSWSEGQRWVETALAHASNKSDAQKAKGLIGLGILHYLQSNYPQACKQFEQSIAIWKNLEDEWWIAFATAMLGFGFFRQGKPSAADLLQESMQIAKIVNDKWLLAFCLHSLGQHDFYYGDLAGGRAMAEESLAQIHSLGDHMIQGDVLGLLGEMADSEQDYPRALRLYEESLAFAHKIEDLDLVANMAFDMGRVYQISGDNEEAERLFTETLQVSLRAGKKSTLIGALAGLGAVAHARGDSSRAVRLLQASESLFDGLHKKILKDPMWRGWFEKNVADARANLSEEEYFALTKEGQAMTPEQAVKYALKDEIKT